MYEEETERLRRELKWQVNRLVNDWLGLALAYGLFAQWLWSWRRHRQGFRRWLIGRGYQPMDDGYWLVPED